MKVKVLKSFAVCVLEGSVLWGWICHLLKDAQLLEVITYVISQPDQGSIFDLLIPRSKSV